MNRRIKFLLPLLLVVATITLVTCKPIGYYLERVYKVYGRVTSMDGVIPLQSVEVSIKGYQYSELTNARGDYEIELAEGTWTLDFVRKPHGRGPDGAPITHNPASVVVTVGPSTPRIQKDVVLYYADWNWYMPRGIADSDQQLTGSVHIDIGSLCEWGPIGTYDITFFSIDVNDRSTGTQLYAISGEVLLASDSRLEVEATAYAGPESLDQIISRFYQAGLGDGVNRIYFPYSITNGQMTITIPDQTGFGPHLLVN